MISDTAGDTARKIWRRFALMSMELHQKQKIVLVNMAEWTLLDFVKEVDRFSRLIEPFAFVLYCLDDIRNWRYPKVTLCLWIICNLCCIILTKGAVFVLVSLLVVVIAATGLVQIHTRILDKILPVNHLSSPDDESSDENDEDSAYSTVRQFRVSIIQMFEFVVKCNELLAHFYGILKWDNILPSLRMYCRELRWLKESCFACKVSFASILKRRFYCRHCGNNFCSKCCNQRVPKSVFGATAPSAQTETVLVCNICHKNLTKAPDKDKKS
ncbi:ZFYVE27 [Mytilus coruscus]|uniref:Protrudin n=1 Tax=Mytilus coruscus TaxID=42192 RepID=A0A6J8EAZ9_MYTCO|nr:ZFYVE27 [Mytilus coruscus]